MTHLHLKQFDGPFDLLLSLIDQEELSITEVSLSQVTEQYLAYLDTLEENKAEELADFLVVATKLLLHKAKQLLPQFLPEEEEGPGLEEQLRLYKQFVEAAKGIYSLWNAPTKTVFREEPSRVSTEFIPPENVTLSGLERVMVSLVHRLAPPKPLPRAHIDKTITLKQKIDSLRSILRKRKDLRFSDVVGDSGNKTELIVSFLAVLELMKQQTLSLKQEGNFSEIMIHAV